MGDDHHVQPITGGQESQKVSSESSDDTTEEIVLPEPFKKPQLIIGPQRGKSYKEQNSKVIRTFKGIGHIKEVVNNVVESEESGSSILVNPEVNDVPLKPPVNPQLSKPSPPLPYAEPVWGGLPSHQYNLEELKSGTIVKTIDLTKRSFSVFGRLENCDIPMLHPTVSRYHAVLQYRVTGHEGDEPGFYIYDLGSSLGTFVNKQKLKPKTFVRVKVGYVMKIGCSTRMFILQGPAEDEEPESELSVTELKQQQQQKLAALEDEKERFLAEEEERKQREEERGVDWGMGEDADEETDLTENPYATTQNEELYIDDPKKTLRGWFEREGEELEYEVEEKGFGHYMCKIELPVDNGMGGNQVAAAVVKGKKREAVKQAALEACKMLDRQGLLRQSNHESKKRVAKDWEAMDFYDSDEDNFLDRTGQIERKRQQRMAQTGKLDQPVETYDTLAEKYSQVVKELENTEHRLSSMLSLATHKSRPEGAESEGEDDLDSYMNTLHELPTDKIQIKKMKDEVARLRAEEVRVRNLVNLVRPTELPKLEPALKSMKEKEKKVELPHGMIGKIANKKRPQQETVLPQQLTQQPNYDADAPEEFDEEEDPPLKTENPIKNEEEVVIKKKRSRTDTRKRSSKRQISLPMQVDEEDYSNCTWTPPKGQTGDGRTSLNDKLGY